MLALVPPVVAISRFSTTRFQALRTLFAVLLLLLLGVAVALPSIWDQLARRLSIASGLDLIVLVLALVVLSGASYMMGKFERINGQIVALTRELALLREAVVNRKPPTP